MINIPQRDTIAIIEIVSSEDGRTYKKRPAYVLKTNGIMLQCFSITSKFETKAKDLQRACFSINDWQYAGLNKPSWINTSQIHSLSVEKVMTRFIGILSEQDTLRFREFLLRKEVSVQAE